MNQCYYPCRGTAMSTKQIEKNLADKEELIKEMNAIFDSVTDGLYITDGDGMTLRVNKAFEEITGIKSRDITGKNVRNLVESGVYNKAVSILVLESKRTISLIETLPNGKKALLTGTPIFDDSGNIFRIVTTLRDMADLNILESRLARTEKKSERYRIELLNLRLRQLDMEDTIIHSQIMRNIMRLAFRLGEVDSTVLITGESGVGKEIVTRAIHQAGVDESRPMVTAVCSAIPENLLESELFGYEKGSFTGAELSGKPGLFEIAEGGTLFLDEIGDISLNIQVKLLRAIQEKEIMRIGGRKPIKINVRIITATNKNLEKMVKMGAFRQDLYYRLNVVPIFIPPLRERKEDIIPLINYFLKKFNKRFNRNIRYTSDVIVQLERYDWPGNVRELENTVERLVVLSGSSLIRKNDIAAHIRDNIGMTPDTGQNRIPPLNEAKEKLEKQIITKAWKKYKSTRKMAGVLEISQSTVVRKMNLYNIGDSEIDA
jgi:PAS domain S-box-containing protein/TyrR family helix-turn-helix protein